jgi:hypothetical protein
MKCGRSGFLNSVIGRRGKVRNAVYLVVREDLGDMGIGEMGILIGWRRWSDKEG